MRSAGNQGLECGLAHPMNAEISHRSSQKNPLAPFVLVPKSFLREFKPSWRAIVAYVGLVYYTNNKTRACERIPIRTIAEIASVSEDTIKRGIAELVKKGVIKVRHRSRKGPNGRIPMPNLYEIQHIESITDPI
jgi:hypothetical protein